MKAMTDDGFYVESTRVYAIAAGLPAQQVEALAEITRMALAAGVAEGRRQAAGLARSMSDNEADGYYGQACYEVAKAIDAL